VERGVEEQTASYIFDLMEKFAGYGFNKSHSAAYALVSYQTMWLKAHYPEAFMAAVLSADMDNTDKVVTLIEECRGMKLAVESPDVNHSEYRFTTSGPGKVVYGLGAVKGVGLSAIEGILEARQQDGAFEDLFEFCRRIDLRKANRRVLEALIRAGALDRLGCNRASLMNQLPLALKMAEQYHEMQEAGQCDLFGMGSELDQGVPDLQVVPDDLAEWDDEIRLQGEKETLGLYLTGHPIERYRDELAAIVSSRIADLTLDDKGPGRSRDAATVTIAGLVVGVRHNRTQRGRMGSAVLDDRSGRIEATLFSEAYEQYRELLSADRVLVISGQLVYDEFRGGLSLRANKVWSFEQAREKFASCLQLTLDRREWIAGGGSAETLVEELKAAFAPFIGGACPVQVCYRGEGARACLLLGPEWRLSPADELLRRLERVFGAQNVTMVYAAARAMSAEPELALVRRRA
jgi:DNA polymerase-3 subunit alpha